MELPRSKKGGQKKGCCFWENSPRQHESRTRREKKGKRGREKFKGITGFAEKNASNVTKRNTPKCQRNDRGRGLIDRKGGKKGRGG